MILGFGFCQKWTIWILSLISSCFFSILVNGSLSSTFSPSRGIRQGDPLSPFLFILTVKGLGHMIHMILYFLSLWGISLHGAPTQIYQHFFDDILLFGFPSVQESHSLKYILDTLSEASCTTINLDKSQIYFFNTDITAQRNIAIILSFLVSSLPFKYLGAPLFDYVVKQFSWRELLDKMEGHIMS